jgi:predicted nucleic acid-binding protein
MRVLLDTNVVVSALPFFGPPRRLLLAYAKLGAVVARTGRTVEELVEGYASQAFIAQEDVLLPVAFAADQSDAVVIAAAHAVHATWLVTGDRHLLAAPEAISCEVLTVGDALMRMASTGAPDSAPSESEGV